MPAAHREKPADARTGYGPIPPTVGIGLKPPHFAAILDTLPAVGFFEAHPENYMAAGGPALDQLERIAERYPLSFHAVGLSLGTAEPLDADHLWRFRRLADRFRPGLVSDHLAWCRYGERVLPDLFPLPYSDETLGVVADNVSRVQDVLGRKILIENPSTYLRFQDDGMDEPVFLAALAERTGCGILFDVNNLYVSANNVGLDAEGYLAALPPGTIGEIHLAGHKTETGPAGTVRIDDHGSPVTDAVWELYGRAVARFGPLPTLIEWDTAVPPLEILIREAEKARTILGPTLNMVKNEQVA